MSNQGREVAAYIELLYTNRQLISDAYFGNGRITATTDSGKALRKLQQHRAVATLDGEVFQLAPSLRRHLDVVFQRQRTFAAGINIEDLIAPLSKIIESYLEAAENGRNEDMDDYESEFEIVVFELHEGIQENLIRFRTLTDNQFGHVRTLAQKRRENEFYVRRAEAMTAALSAIENDSMVELLESNVLLQELHRSFRLRVLDHLPGWRLSLQEIAHLLTKFLYKMREIQPKAQMIRRLAMWFHKNPDFEFPEHETVTKPSAWMLCIEGVSMRAHPNLLDPAVADELAPIVENLPEPKFIIEKDERPSAVAVAHLPPEVFVKQARLAHDAWFAFIEEAVGMTIPVSALDWQRTQPLFGGIRPDLWLLFVAHRIATLEKEDDIDPGVLFWHIDEVPDGEHCGNTVIQDVLVCRSNFLRS